MISVSIFIFNLETAELLSSRPQRRTSSKNCGRAASCLSLLSHIFFLGAVKEIYNEDLTLCIHPKISPLILRVVCKNTILR
jgi:hypothetical protein